MFSPNYRCSNLGKRTGGNGLVAVGIDKVNKVSQYALKWAVDNLLSKGQTIILIHVLHNKSSSSSSSSSYSSANGVVCDNGGTISEHQQEIRDLFLTFHCYCTRKDIQCLDVILENSNIAKALVEYVSSSGIENLVLGASKHSLMRRLRMNDDTPSHVIKGAPDFCSVYVISKTKVSSARYATQVAPFTSPLLSEIQSMQVQSNSAGNSPEFRLKTRLSQRGTPRRSSNASEAFRSPLARGKTLTGRMFNDSLEPDSDISFVSSDRPSTDISYVSSARPSIDRSFISSGRPSTDISFVSSGRPSTDISFLSSGRPSTDISFVSSGRPSTDCMSSMFGENVDSGRTSLVSTSSDGSLESLLLEAKATDLSPTGFSSSPLENEDVDNEMRRLKLELQRTMELYSTACKEAVSAQQKAAELQRWRLEEEKRLEEAKQSEEGALNALDKEHAEHKSALEHIEAAQRIAELESQRRINVEKKMTSVNACMYRRYPIGEIEEATENFAESRKVGEGGYGPVFKCYLDHTPVAVKVLRPDAAQGRSQFHQEVEVLSCMRHPNLVLLLGACPEYGCLIYEYMANGSLEDRLLQKGNTPALPWQHRFRIAAEVATALHFLHQTKPEPLVHRDLKPANILLDNNYASKISDVGLARLVPSIADDVTQCCVTSAAGTLCYIDPEYQQTGVLGVKSDVYSLGIVFLQLLTGKPAMGLTGYVDRSIESETFSEMLDPAVPDWPVEDSMSLANLALQCAELRRKDRPDLGKVVLPELNRLRELANQSLDSIQFSSSANPSPNHSKASTTQGEPTD